MVGINALLNSEYSQHKIDTMVNCHVECINSQYPMIDCHGQYIIHHIHHPFKKLHFPFIIKKRDEVHGEFSVGFVCGLRLRGDGCSRFL